MAPDVQEMTAEELSAYARDVVVRRLTDQARTRADLAESLAKKHVPDDVARQTLDQFEKAGLVDDEEFARSWVKSRQRSKGLAPKVLALELRRKGVDDEYVQSALAELDPEAETAAAHRLVQKKLRSMGQLDQQVKIRRLLGLLGRKGYAPQVAFDVVREELEATEQESEQDLEQPPASI